MSKPLTRREFKESRKREREARRLAAVELERRLTHLNGETARAAEVAKNTVQDGTYKADQRGLDSRLKVLESAEDKRSGALRLIAIVAASGFMAGVFGLAGLIWQASTTHTIPQPVPQVYYVPAAPGTMVPSSPTQPQPR